MSFLELIDTMAERTPGFVGSYIHGICTEALLGAIREKIPAMHNKYTQSYRSEAAAKAIKDIEVNLHFCNPTFQQVRTYFSRTK